MQLHIEHPTPVFTSFTLEWGPLGAIVGTLNQIGELGLTVDRHTQKLKKYPKKSLYVLYGSHTRLLSSSSYQDFGLSCDFRATSHTRLRARDQYTSNTLIGGKGGAGPSSLHTPLEGPTEYVNARWMQSLHGFLHGNEWIMFHGHLDYFHNHLLEVGLTQNWETMTL